LATLGGIAYHSGAYAEARGWFERSLAVGRESGHPFRIAASLHWLSQLAADQGRLEEAQRAAREFITAYTQEGKPAWFQHGLYGHLLVRCGAYGEARSVLQESLDHYQGQAHPLTIAGERGDLAFAEAHLGHYEQARASAQLALDAKTDLPPGIAWTVHLVQGWVALATGDPAEAARRLQESVRLGQGRGNRPRAAWAVASLAYAARRTGEAGAARQHLREALGSGLGLGTFYPVLYALPAAALLLVDEGEVEAAVELYALAARYPPVANSRWFEDVAGAEIAAAAEGLPPEVVAAAQERGRARDVRKTAKEVLEELGGSL
jgi:tetratricopeptide (TPR) repeat protein